MRRLWLVLGIAVATATLAAIGLAQQASAPGPYKVLQTAKVGGEGGFDYLYADADGRKLYVPRMGPSSRVSVYNLDTLAPVGEIPMLNAKAVVVASRFNHGFVNSKPVVMFDSKTLATIRTIDVQSAPDSIMFDSFNDRVYVQSHQVPNVTVIDAKDGTVLGTIDPGGAPEGTVSDGKGRLFIILEDKDKVAVIDTKKMTVTGHYDISDKAHTCPGLALDAKNHILFAACRKPNIMVILNADDGNVITTLPIGVFTDGATFNPKTMEAFSAQRDATLTVVKENSPTSFEVEQNVPTMSYAKTLTLDSKTNRIFVMGAEYGPPPATPPPGTPPGFPMRGEMVPDSFAILAIGR
jgi:DNA-binding beta-propeller fold protein YncE